MAGRVRGSAYISGPLTAVDDLARARAFYERLGAVCAAVGLRPYVPHLRTDPELHADLTAQTVYERDTAALTRAAVVVAHIGAPSSGVGAELALAGAAGTPILAVRRRGEQVSRFLLGYLDAVAASVVTVDDADLQAVVTAALRDLLARAAEAQT